MRIGIFSDVHGNLQALEATLSALTKKNVDQLICLGDVATLGLQPREVVALLMDLECRFILGNHESVLFDPEKHDNFRIPEILLPAIHWCKKEIGDSGMKFLKTFSTSETIKLNDYYTLFAFHGRPTSNYEQFDLFNKSDLIEVENLSGGANVFAGGHTHIQVLQRFKKFSFINPGSVGCLFDTYPIEAPEPSLLPFAEFAIVEANGEELSVESYRIPYSTGEIKKIVAGSTYPLKDWWLKQFKE